MLLTHMLLLALAASTSAAPARSYESLARTYFDAWNKHDLTALRPLFAETATLKDWDVEKSGADEVVQANGAIFAKEPKISIDVQTIHTSEETRSAICEVLVRLNDAKVKVMKVAKVLTFDAAGKIEAVNAYKGRTTMA